MREVRQDPCHQDPETDWRQQAIRWRWEDFYQVRHARNRNEGAKGAGGQEVCRSYRRHDVLPRGEFTFYATDWFRADPVTGKLRCECLVRGRAKDLKTTAMYCWCECELGLGWGWVALGHDEKKCNVPLGRGFGGLFFLRRLESVTCTIISIMASRFAPREDAVGTRSNMATLSAGNGEDFKSTLFICIANNGMIQRLGNPNGLKTRPVLPRVQSLKSFENVSSARHKICLRNKVWCAKWIRSPFNSLSPEGF